MIKKPLEQLFDAMHHGKYAYADFLSGTLENNFRRQIIGPSTRRREILAPNKKLKDFLVFLNLFVFDHLPVCRDAVFSYRKGATPMQAVEIHRNSRYFLQMDIKNFFPSINRALVERALLEGGETTPVADIQERKERILDMVCIDGHLPLGFPTSPPISNAILNGFDVEMKGYCKRIGVRYTRYSDDLIFSSESPIPQQLPEEVAALIRRHSDDVLSIHSGKTKLFRTGGKIKILGMMILPNGRITIDSKIKSELEVLLHFYITDKSKFFDLCEGDEQAGIERAAGYLTYANSVDPEYIGRLRKKFGAATVDMVLHRSYPQ